MLFISCFLTHNVSYKIYEENQEIMSVWAKLDLNQRPIGYEPIALTNWAIGPYRHVHDSKIYHDIKKKIEKLLFFQLFGSVKRLQKLTSFGSLATSYSFITFFLAQTNAKEAKSVWTNVSQVDPL